MSTLMATATLGWAFNPRSAEMLFRASLSCNPRRGGRGAREGWRPRAAVTLCTVRKMGRRLLRCCAALTRPLATAT